MTLEKGIFLRAKDEYDCEFILSPISNFNRTTYLNLRLLIRTILSLPLALYLGYSLYYTCNSIVDIKSFILSFIITYILSFYLIQIPHELIHYIIYSNFLSDQKAKIKLFNRKRLITSTYNGEINYTRSLLGLIAPVLIISSILSVILILKGFNIVIYGVMWANLIISAEDILNIFIYISSNDVSKGIYELPNDYNYLINEMQKQDE
ncbi:DUF3267 domain-containing protein [Clostridium disporicum]|uniref:Protein of uncharacterized function (DUF3267) n=1 Tax=Clostridium disporicum TaxID=84024 RepID=A0A173Y3Y8_9CLOT|nr:DUF3267 domain-containing protein [Clostridium disporicum]CUN58882.1 Protein of uncharacterised function (DUF3267) [Clostridium disporicum]